MLFTSGIFVFVYLPVVLLGYMLCLRFAWGRAGIAWLALASLAFYAYWDAKVLVLLFASMALNYTAGALLDKSVWNPAQPARKVVLVAVIVCNLAGLAYFKYANLLVTSVGALTGEAVSPLDIVLPLGISFYTFTQLAYVVDAYVYGRSERSPTAYVLFVTFFPHLVAGPVLHHSEMMPQFLRPQPRSIDPAMFIEGLAFFVIGLVKKVLIADNVAPAANRVFDLAGTQQLGFVDSWYGALAYTVQIYFDFSGYSDMAVGLALMFMIRLPFNFDSPYRATSIVDFWRCWHMTLSRFLRDYLYIPLGGNRHGPMRRHLNLMITMLLGGLWHGASWTFLVWGGLHGMYLLVNHVWRGFVSRSATLGGWASRNPTICRVAAVALTMFCVIVAWVFFRAESFQSAGNMLAGMLLGAQTMEAEVADANTLFYMVLGLLIAFLLPNSQQLIGAARDRLKVQGIAGFMQGAMMGALAFAVVALVVVSASNASSEFIYFNF